MAITNQERVGTAMDLLRAGLAPFVERKLKNQHQEKAAEATRRYFVDDRTIGKKPITEWDVAALLKLMWEAWNEVFSRTLGRAERSLVQVPRPACPRVVTLASAPARKCHHQRAEQTVAAANRVGEERGPTTMAGSLATSRRPFT
jgi:hypothetical protein